jgi:hypothetical protein
MPHIRSASPIGWISLGIVALAACSPTALVDVSSPSNLVDPAQAKSAAAAAQLYNFATTNFAIMLGGTSVVPNFVVSTGIFTDEFEKHNGTYTLGFGLDERTNIALMSTGLATVGQSVYTALQQARVETSQAREALALYAPTVPKASQGQMYALQAYTLVYLGEYFCSGLPLTHVALDGTITYHAGYTTPEVFQQALALFDSAMALSPDSARILNLAQVGKGRAFLDLGAFDSAAAIVHTVPTGFAYNAEYSTSVTGGANFLGNQQITGGSPVGFPVVVVTVDREGTNGLRWSIDSATGPAAPDPRIALVQAGGLTFTTKYSPNGVATPAALLRVADGVEARLIEAEADLKNGGTNWLNILNTLRATCTTASGCAPVSGITSTTFAPLLNPATPAARLNLLMSERARWLYATGHRQGDLRRQLKLYGRTQDAIYPTGTYTNSTAIPSSYGTDVVMVPPITEQRLTPKYTGCVNFDP